MNSVVFRNKEEFENKVDRIKKQGKHKLHIISDFDRTLTYKYVQGIRPPNSYNKIVEILGPECEKLDREMFDKYFPIETSKNMSLKEKIPYMEKWWEEHFEMNMNHNLNEKHFKEISEKDVYLRNGFKEFISFINNEKIQFLIFSAGLGNVIENVFKDNDWLKENVHIISNFYFFNEKGEAIKFNENLIHVFNKNEAQIPVEYKNKIKEKTNLILIGDSLNDVNMSQGLMHENILNIGFLNDDDKELEKEYLKFYDVVIKNDSDFSFINDLIKKIILFE